jgi:hypothetical protein
MGYRQNVLNRIPKKDNPDHPIYNGVTMQAHHLLSKQGIEESGLKEDLEHLGYDIDFYKNIVLLPSTLQGACHLNVQVHRGNHGSTHSEAEDDDDQHKIGYHDKVTDLVEQLEDLIDQGKFCEVSKIDLIKSMNIRSNIVLSRIKKNRLALSTAYRNFGLYNSNGKGCSNQTSISKVTESSPHCVMDRIHLSDGIRISKQDYELEVGR